jgi:hypothetical protein
MKLNKLAFFLLGGALIIFNLCCKKFDNIPEQNSKEINVLYTKFFNSNRTNDAAEKVIVNYVERVILKHNFVTNAINQIGYPRWDKTIVIRAENKSNSLTSSDDSSNTYYIPFVRDSQNFVNASLVIFTNNYDTSFTFKYDWKYKQMQNTVNSINDSAEKFALFFMNLDKAVFGHTKFKILDQDLFRQNNKKGLFIVLSNSTNQNNLVAQVQCTDVQLSYNDCPYSIGHCYGPGGVCDAFSFCVNGECTSSVEYQYCDDGGGAGGGTSSGDGDGSGLPNGDGPPGNTNGGGPTGNGGGCSSCGSGGQQGPNGSPIGTGWVPVSMIIEPCETIVPLKNSTNYKSMFNQFKATALDTSFTYEFSASFSDVNQQNYNIATGINEPKGEVKIIAQPGETITGCLHTHYKGTLPIFSVGDLRAAYDIVKNNINLAPQITLGLATSQGNNYVLTIENIDKFMIFGNEYFNNEDNDEILERFYKGYKIGKFTDNAKNEAAFLELLSDKNAGLTLLKPNSALDSYSVLKHSSSTTVTETPCN